MLGVRLLIGAPLGRISARGNDQGSFDLKILEKNVLPAKGDVTPAGDYRNTPVKLSEADYDLEYGRGTILKAELPGKHFCQIEFACPDFVGVLQLETASGKLLATASGTGAGNARILLHNPETTTYRIVAMARSGAPSAKGTLTVRLMKDER